MKKYGKKQVIFACAIAALIIILFIFSSSNKENPDDIKENMQSPSQEPTAQDDSQEISVAVSCINITFPEVRVYSYQENSKIEVDITGDKRVEYILSYSEENNLAPASSKVYGRNNSNSKNMIPATAGWKISEVVVTPVLRGTNTQCYSSRISVSPNEFIAR